MILCCLSQTAGNGTVDIQSCNIELFTNIQQLKHCKHLNVALGLTCFTLGNNILPRCNMRTAEACLKDKEDYLLLCLQYITNIVCIINVAINLCF